MVDFRKKPVLKENCIRLTGSYHHIKDWVMDRKGYFLIRLNKNTKEIEAGYCKKDNEIEILISGKTPQDVYHIITMKKLVTRTDHAAYLGKELEKAYLALKYNLDYVQDEELKI